MKLWQKSWRHFSRWYRVGRDFNFECCDCGLTHRVQHDGERMRVKQDRAATRRARKKLRPDVLSGR